VIYCIIPKEPFVQCPAILVTLIFDEFISDLLFFPSNRFLLSIIVLSSGNAHWTSPATRRSATLQPNFPSRQHLEDSENLGQGLGTTRQ
jgi:hypothetical protein